MGAQSADCMIKGAEKAQKSFELLKQKNWRWRLVYDLSFTSARTRTQKGHGVLDYLPSALDETLDYPGLHNLQCRIGGFRSFAFV